MVTSYFSVKHLTVSFVRATTAHTGPFHTLLNHPSGLLLTITNLPVYCHTFVLAILSWSAWPLEMKALCFLKHQEPMPQLHSIITQKTCILNTVVSVSDLANTCLTVMQMSVCP